MPNLAEVCGLSKERTDEIIEDLRTIFEDPKDGAKFVKTIVEKYGQDGNGETLFVGVVAGQQLACAKLGVELP